MTAVSRGHARALSASLCWGIGAHEQARQLSLTDAIEQARCKAKLLHCSAYVYWIDGRYRVSTSEPDIMPGAELIREVGP
jgi:hypothetical protein